MDPQYKIAISGPRLTFRRADRDFLRGLRRLRGGSASAEEVPGSISDSVAENYDTHRLGRSIKRDRSRSGVTFAAQPLSLHFAAIATTGSKVGTDQCPITAARRTK